MKTVLSHLNDLPEPYRSQAIKNTSFIKGSFLACSQSDAIFTAFNWKNAPEGSSYWQRLFAQLITDDK